MERKNKHICFCKQDLFVHEDHLPCRKFWCQGGSSCETSTKLQQLLPQSCVYHISAPVHQSSVPNCTSAPVICTQLHQCTNGVFIMISAPVHQPCVYHDLCTSVPVACLLWSLYLCTGRVFILISASVHQSCVYNGLCNNAPVVCTQLQHGSKVFIVSSATALFCP